jgi:hypothetical protein
MDVGQVGFHVDKHVKQYVVDKKQNEIVNRLNKTKTEVSTEDFIVKYFLFFKDKFQKLFDTLESTGTT